MINRTVLDPRRSFWPLSVSCGRQAWSLGCTCRNRAGGAGDPLEWVCPSRAALRKPAARPTPWGPPCCRACRSETRLSEQTTAIACSRKPLLVKARRPWSAEKQWRLRWLNVCMFCRDLLASIATREQCLQMGADGAYVRRRPRHPSHALLELIVRHFWSTMRLAAESHS